MFEKEWKIIFKKFLIFLHYFPNINFISQKLCSSAKCTKLELNVLGFIPDSHLGSPGANAYY